mgnify:CR=1 FL=1
MIDITISYKAIDSENGIEESDIFSFSFDSFPTYNEVLEAWCCGTCYCTKESRQTLDISFWLDPQDGFTAGAEF